MKKFLLIVLPAAVAAASVPFICSWSEMRMLNKPEEKVYTQMKKLSSTKLIKKINRIDLKLPSMEDKTNLVPLYRALIDKSGEFSDEQLIDMIKDSETLYGIDCAFIEMYVKEGYDPQKLSALLDDPDIADETKEYIVLNNSYTVDELCDIFRKHNGRSAVIAMQKIVGQDAETALKLADDILDADSSTNISDEKYIAVCLGIANYYGQRNDLDITDPMKENYVSVLKRIFEQCDSENVKDQAIYALGRICDYDLFTWIIENDKIDFLLKVSVIERNVALMKKQIALSESEDDIRTILKAMELHPVTEIADSLNEAIERGKLAETDELLAKIAYIRKNGISFSKYEDDRKS